MKGYYIRFIKIVPALGIGLSFKSRAFPVSAGAAVITPQRRFTRALQGSPQVFKCTHRGQSSSFCQRLPKACTNGKTLTQDQSAANIPAAMYFVTIARDNSICELWQKLLHLYDL